MAKFKVVREHFGDRMYAVGEERELDEKAAAHLVPRVLQPVVEKKKAERAPRNKAEGAAPANKASSGRKAK